MQRTLTKTNSHQRTNRQINRKLKPLEIKLNKILLNFYTQNIKDSLTPVQILKQKYDRRLKALITKPIQDSYMVAINTIAEKTDVPISLTPNDLINIQNIVNQTSEAFWNTCVRLVFRQIEVDTINRVAAFGLKNPFKETAAFVANAVKSVFQSFNTAIISKISEVRNLITNEPDITEFPQAITGLVRFTTKGDSLVCPNICLPLDGNVYDVDDPDIPNPQDPSSDNFTHFHCRCKLVPI